MILQCAISWMLISFHDFTSAFTANPNREWHRMSTKLAVSELHVPGYTESKKPFMITDEQQLAQIQQVQYSKHDFESLIPYGDGYLLHKTKAVLTSRECQDIIDEAEHVAARIKWTTNRHGNYPTTDLPLVELPKTLQFLRVALVSRLYPLLRAQFGEFIPDPSKLRVADGFVVKYDADAGQKELKPHRDGSVLSFNIALNPANEFEGGGTWFASLNDAIKIDQGDVVSHASGLLHGGHGITRGKRYILVAFVIVEDFSSWSMRFYNQIRNC